MNFDLFQESFNPLIVKDIFDKAKCIDKSTSLRLVSQHHSLISNRIKQLNETIPTLETTIRQCELDGLLGFAHKLQLRKIKALVLELIKLEHFFKLKLSRM